MLMPSVAVMIAVITTKMADLISGALSPSVLMSASPKSHPGSAEQRRGQQAAPGGQRRRWLAQRQRRQLPDELGLGRRAGHAAGAGRAQGGCGAGLAAGHTGLVAGHTADGGAAAGGTGRL